MEQTALFADPAPASSSKASRRRGAKAPIHLGPIPSGPEVATVWRANEVGALFLQEYPNPSEILRERSRGRGVALYQTMLKTDSDLAGFYHDLADDILHYPSTITPFSDQPEHLEHARFVRFAIRRIRNWQNVLRHAISAYAWGYAIFEKVYEVIDRGEWAGAVTFAELLDRPHPWFTFDPERRIRFKTVQNSSPGELVDQNKFIAITFGSNSTPWGDPTLDYVYFPYRLKHHALKNQAIYMEKYASPTLMGEYDYSPTSKFNKLNKDNTLAVLQSAQIDQSIVVPRGTIVKLMESVRNGLPSYEGYVGQLTEMESRLVTGQILTSMGAEGGSYALGKVHEKRAANKVEMLANWTSEDFATRRVVRELVVRNYGHQDGYPEYRILAKSPIARQAEATLEQQQLANGHRLSRTYYDIVQGIVPPLDEADSLVPSVTAKPGQVLPANSQLAAPEKVNTCSQVEFARHPDLHKALVPKAAAKQKRFEAIGRDAVSKARPAIKKAVRALAAVVRSKGKKGLNRVTRTHVYSALKGIAGTSQLGDALDTMLDRPTKLGLAAADDAKPPEISTAARLALALQLLAIAERIFGATADAAADGADPGAFADSLTDPAGVGVDEAFGDMFEGTHSTNIADVATAQLRAQLADPRFRQKYPYVMLVVTNPNARLSHRMLDGYIISSEEARYSPFLAPLDFGCDCQNVLISAEEAKARGLTGAAPVGTLDEFLQSKGATPAPRGGYQAPDGQVFNPGGPLDFAPAYAGTDSQVQLAALREKAEELRRKDPEAWAALQKWLDWLFGGADVLRQDPPE